MEALRATDTTLKGTGYHLTAATGTSGIAGRRDGYADPKMTLDYPAQESCSRRYARDRSVWITTEIDGVPLPIPKEDV